MVRVRNAEATGTTSPVQLELLLWRRLRTRPNELLRAVRQAPARFNSTTQAIRVGYLPDDHCVEVPPLGGGMGYHWLNPALLDAVHDPLQPEVLLYAPGPGGNLRLVAVEYITLAPADADLEYLGGVARPRFGTSQLFDIGGTPDPRPHWSLHVWLYEDNPNALFYLFNPNVSCPAPAAH